MPEPAAPRATYRLQLRAEFGFDDAARVAEHLAALGVSHVYCSPSLQAAPGSAHGYDVVDHSRVNEELGGAAAHTRFVRRLADLGLGQVVDVVPNHMAVGSPLNRWWWDVLEHGPSSRFADHFDVDWDPPEAKLRNRVLLPILGDRYGRELEAGTIVVTWDDDGRFRIRYHEHEAPVAPPSLDGLLADAARRCSTPVAADLAFIARSLARLPAATATSPDERRIRHRDTEVLHAQLVRLRDEVPEVGAAVRAAVDDLNADVDALDAFLDRQNVRLAHWRTASDELDYRRFFDVTTLAGLRVEDADVFADTHGLILSWVAADEAQGLRIDHPDGLRDPGGYLEMLRAAAPDAWIVVEKILAPGERLPASWPVEGTTGYDLCATLTRLLHDERGIGPIVDLYEEVVGEAIDLPEVEHAAKVSIMANVLLADVRRVADLLASLADQDRRWRDLTRGDLHDALVEVVAGHDVYRTYVRPGAVADEVDAAVIARALAAAAVRRPDLDVDLWDLLGLVLRGELDEESPTAEEVRLRIQQLTGPVMAKGVEDTVLYDVVPLVSLNEVGADPGTTSVSVDEWHDEMVRRAEEAPRSMLALSTHDTKRSEDVRARLAVLSEVPGARNDLVRWWVDVLGPHRADGWHDPRMELLLLQSLVGAHPLPADRAAAYMEKASKEAKRHTSWIDPVPEYDAGLRQLVEGACADAAIAERIADFVAEIVTPGRVNSLAQKLLCLTVPGVPDLYQGSEAWDLSLVDPDNRRPVDHVTHARLLADAAALTPEQRWARADDGTPKIWTVHRALAVRAAHPDWFDGASYQPLVAEGPAASHVVAHRRGESVAVVVPRLPVGLDAAGGWRDTTITLPEGDWWNEFGEQRVEGGTIALDEILERFPVALLHTDVPHGGGGER